MNKSMSNVIRGQEWRDQLVYNVRVRTLLNDEDDDDVDVSVVNVSICGDNTNDGWIDEVVKEPLQRQNAWTQEEITKLLD